MVVLPGVDESILKKKIHKLTFNCFPGGSGHFHNQFVMNLPENGVIGPIFLDVVANGFQVQRSIVALDNS